MAERPIEFRQVKPEHHQGVLALFAQKSFITRDDIRKGLRISISMASTVIEDMLLRGLIRKIVHDKKPLIVQYVQGGFDHDPSLVRKTWMKKFTQYFQEGGSGTAISIAQQHQLDLDCTRATLEEMRKQGLVHGRFVGAGCIYSGESRMVEKQATPADLERVASGTDKLTRYLRSNNATVTVKAQARRNHTSVKKVVSKLLKSRKNLHPELGEDYLQVIEAADALGVDAVNLGRWANRRGYSVRKGNYAWISASDLLNYNPRHSVDFQPIDVGA